MPNIAVVLKQEIARLARKEARTQVASLKKASAQYRRDIALLKRQLGKVAQYAVRLNRNVQKSAAPAAEEPATKVRFVSKGLRSQRTRLGLSAAEFGKLVGVTAQSIYNWESGATRPRPQQLAAIAQLRTIGRKEARARLGAVAGVRPARRAKSKR